MTKKYLLVEISIKTTLIASINPCKNTASDKIIPVGCCHMKILVRAYKAFVGHEKWL